MPARPLVSLVTTLLFAGTLAGCNVVADPGAVRPSSSSSSHRTVSEVVGVTTYPADARPSLPAIAGRTLAGTTISLAAMRGHLIVLNVWASWCAPCRAESPALARVAAETAASGVDFVGIDEQDVASNARAFAAAAGATYPQLVDDAGVLLAKLRIVPLSAIPSTLVLDPKGDVAARVIGPIDASTFADLVRSLAGGSSGTPAS
jgi:thiol-disulfide isomerase/thioredoxin